MDKKVTFNGSVNDAGFYVTAVFTAKSSVGESTLQKEADGFHKAFKGAFELRYSERYITVETFENRIICHLAYTHREILSKTVEDSWDDSVRKDAENLIAQLELRLSHIE